MQSSGEFMVSKRSSFIIVLLTSVAFWIGIFALGGLILTVLASYWQ